MPRSLFINIDPESLKPKLPSRKDLRPYPSTCYLEQGIKYRSISPDVDDFFRFDEESAPERARVVAALECGDDEAPRPLRIGTLRTSTMESCESRLLIDCGITIAIP